MNNKRGTHVGVILSFAIFIIFLFFLYSIIEPIITTQEDKKFLLNYLERELIKKSSFNITSTTIQVNETINPNKDCVKVQNVIGEIVNETDLIIKDQNGNILNYSISGQALIVETGYNFSGFLKIYYSGELDPSPPFDGGGCEPITGVSVGLIVTYEDTFESKVIDLIERYETDYENLKKELNIPADSDFAFSFTYSNGSIIGTEEVDLQTSIYVQEIPIKYVDEEGEMNMGIMKIIVWTI